MKLNHIYNENCIDFMEKIKTDSILVDIIITSPPYNIGLKYGKYYNDNQPKKEYLNRMKTVARKSLGILKDNGSFFLNVGFTSKNPLLSFERASIFEHIGYKIQNTIIWLKSIGKSNGSISEGGSIGHFKPINSDCYLSNLYEYVFHFTKTGNIKLNKLAIGVPYQDKSNKTRGKFIKPDLRDRGNVFLTTYETIQEKRPHPSVFPMKLPKKCIKLHGYNKNTIVYDPFMGIGTTALACIDLGVNYLGTEINTEYVHEAEQKINNKQNLLWIRKKKEKIGVGETN